MAPSISEHKLSQQSAVPKQSPASRSPGSCTKQDSSVHQFGVGGLYASLESCQLLRDMASSKTLKAGETLFWEDDPAKYAYLLIDGALKAYKLLPNGRSQIVRLIVAGELLASTRFASHDYTTQALGDSVLLQLPRTSFDRLMASDPVLCASVTDKLFAELQQAQKQVLLLGRMPAIERVSCFLLDIAERQNPDAEVLEKGLLVELPLARSDIADYLGLTIETVSRVFSRFRRNGLIDLPRPNLVCLRDQSGLQDQGRL